MTIDTLSARARPTAAPATLERLMSVDPKTIQHMTRNEADMAFKKRVQTIFEWIPPRDDSRILDCACGRGFYLNMYRYTSRCQLVGLELDAEVIGKAQRNVGHLPDVTLARGNIYALPFPDDYFDGVILSEILEHIDDDVAGLREVWRVLKPGGAVAITVPNANYPFLWDPINKTLETIFHTKIRRGPLAGIWANHVRLYERDGLRRAVEAAGFVVEAERAFTHYSFPFIHNLVYGLGKPLLESGAMPKPMAEAADRTTFDQNRGSLLNPINFGVAVLNLFDRPNKLDEPPGRSTVNLAIQGRKQAD
jgi:SAM-dependent methyltransferase